MCNTVCEPSSVLWVKGDGSKSHACLHIIHQKKQKKTSTDKHAAEVKCKAVDRGTQSKCVFG